MSIQNNFPAIRPSLNLDFANTKELDPRITFTRASTASYYGTETAKAEENLLLQSQDFTTTWANASTTDTANTTVAPDGASTADTLAETAITTFFAISQNFSATSGLAYTYSVFLKKGSGATAPDIIQLTFAIGSFGSIYANFNLNTGVVGTTSGLTASIVSAGSGWYRCIVTATSTASSTTSNVQVVFTNNNDALGRAPAYAGSITSDVFVWGAQLEQRSAATAYTPTTTQPITNYIPVLETAASGVARFDHNPTTFESLGLLVEEQRTNLVTYSEQFDNAAWVKSGATVTANTVVALDGTLTGDKLVENTALSTHIINPLGAPIVTAGTTYTFSVYAKAAERSFVQLRCGASSQFSAIYNLATGEATSIVGAVTTTTGAVGNGWWRVSISFAADATPLSVRIGIATNGTTTSYTGDGYSGIYIWGVQLEAGAFPTSYVPTVASQVTRAADAASMTGANFSSWYNQSEGTLFAEMQKIGDLSFQQILNLNDNSTNNSIALGFGSGSFPLRLDVASSGVSQAQITGLSTTTTNTNYKTAAAYKANDFAITTNAGTVITDTIGTVPVLTQMGIGFRNVSSALTLTGYIRRIAFYPKRLSNTELIGLTS